MPDTRRKALIAKRAGENSTQNDQNDYELKQLREWKAKLNVIKKWDKLKTFHEPVTDEYAPNYSNEIDHPMDLMTIENKLQNKQYVNECELVEDLYLICVNAWEYNGKRTDNVSKKIHLLATELWNKVVTVFQRNVADENFSQTSQMNIDQHQQLETVEESQSKLEKSKPLIIKVYETVVKWKRNLTKLPSGKVGKDFISQLTICLNRWCDNNGRDTSLYEFMILPSLILQKTEKTPNKITIKNI